MLVYVHVIHKSVYFQHFHDIAYKAISRDELLHAINEFLDESIVLPPGDWDQKTLLPIMDMARKKARTMRRKKHKEEEKMGECTEVPNVYLSTKTVLVLPSQASNKLHVPYYSPIIRLYFLRLICH